jgi:hypothetical protein
MRLGKYSDRVIVSFVSKYNFWNEAKHDSVAASEENDATEEARDDEIR